MNLFDVLNSKNFTAYAMKHYDDPQCDDIDEFYQDLNRFKYLKRLLHRYYESGELKERLMLNHLITLFNVFGYGPCMKMLDYKITDDKHWLAIKTLLIFLNYIPDTWRTEIPIDQELADRLRQL